MVYTDHKNLTYKNFNTEHVMRWWLLIEEFGPTIEDIKGPKNIIANMLSRLDLVSSPSNPQDMPDCYGLDKDDLPSDTFQITTEYKPWEQLCVDLIGPYKIQTKKCGHKIPELRCVPIDPATGWFKIKQYDDKKSITVANIVKQEWLARYPRHYLITLRNLGKWIFVTCV